MIYIAVLIALAIAATAIYKKLRTDTDKNIPQDKNEATNETKKLSYRRQKKLLTPAEHSFYKALKQAIGSEYDIFVKIRIADILQPEQGNRSEWQTAFNKIANKHFDFVICEKNHIGVIATIELNDESHNTPDRAKRDQFIKDACNNAKLPLIMIKAKASYNIEEIKKLISPTAKDQLATL